MLPFEGPAASRSRRWLAPLFIGLLAVAVFAADQASKAFVRANMFLGESTPRDGFFRFTYTTNTGSAFGLFHNQATALILASIVGIAVLLVLYRQQAKPSPPLRLSLGLQLGGAVGNLADRLILGRVTDFIDVGPWPVFNLADSAIVIGILIIAYHLMFGQDVRKPRLALPPPQPPTPETTAFVIDGPDLLPIPEVRHALDAIPVPAYAGVVAVASLASSMLDSFSGTAPEASHNGHVLTNEARPSEDRIDSRGGTMVDLEKWEPYILKAPQLTEERKERLRELGKRVDANREEIRRRHGNIDVAELIHQVRREADIEDE